MTSTNSCSYCTHFYKQTESAGECRRYPPQVVVLPVRDSYDNIYHQLTCVWPDMNNNDICGEYNDQPE